MKMKTVAVVPCYKSSSIAPKIIKDLIEYVDFIVCVDDFCPEGTGRAIQKQVKSKKVKVIFHQKNKGVGGATKTGIKFSESIGAEIIVKIDSDGQMDPSYIPFLIEPILNQASDFSKGNRFRNINVLIKMPKLRLIGNIFLSFITKLSTGYWELFDPTNGFIAINTKILRRIEYEKTDNRYFFETDLLFRCGLYDLVISEIEIPTIYENENSDLNLFFELYRYTLSHIMIFIKRIVYQYFLIDFNPGSLSFLLGILSGIYTLIAGLRSIIYYKNINIESPIGIKILFLTSAIISVQLIISFIYYDSTQRPLKRQLKSISRKRN
tara:strand:+ start:666 stop:1634 length:969 start_codon:yes stop_codon:yes gene_type:complete